uniref:Uncharacterized protein n=1 Tax=Ditylenchus dipsaci TaxID=166011 RepID=A0A915EN37_9BILA
MSADDSVAQFIRRVHCSMDRLGQIWDRVGMDQKTRDCKTQTAYIHFCTLLDDIVKAEEDMASGVASNIGAHRLAVADLRSFLGMTHFNDEIYASGSISLLNALDKELSILSELKDKAVALDIDSPVCNDISLKIMPEVDLEELENRRKELSNQVKQRVNTAVNLQTICRKMYKPMLKSVTFSAEQENLLNTDFTGPLAIISDKVLQELKELHKYLETEYTSWLDQISIQYAKLMVQLKEFSTKCICLNQYSQVLSDRFDIEHQSEEDLAKLAAEVDRLKKRYHKGQPVFDDLSRWLVLWQEKLELDDHACNSQNK